MKWLIRGGNHGSLRCLHGVEVLFWLWEEVIGVLIILLPSEEIVVSR